MAAKAAKSDRLIAGVRKLMGFLNSLRVRFITAPMWAANMRSVWAWQRIAPMATGKRCSPVKRNSEIEWILSLLRLRTRHILTITKALLEASFNVLCEKPMTLNDDEGEEIVRVDKAAGKICAR